MDHKLTSAFSWFVLNENYKKNQSKKISENVNIILAKMLIPLTAWGNAIVQGHPSPCVIEGQLKHSLLNFFATKHKGDDTQHFDNDFLWLSM